MRGLHLDYEAYVEPKQPKDLVEALKFTMTLVIDQKGVLVKGRKKINS